MSCWLLLIPAVDVYDKTSLQGRAFVVLSCYSGWIEQSVFLLSVELLNKWQIFIKKTAMKCPFEGKLSVH